jgi:uncharacterized membrane protein
LGSNHLIAIGYDDMFKADEARIAVKRMAYEGICRLQDSAAVIKQYDGRLVLSRDEDIVATRKNAGHWVGILAALATGVQPLILVGTAAGALIGRLTNTGLDGKFLKDVGKALQPGRSALFVLGGNALGDVMLERLKPLGGTVLHATVSDEVIREISQALEGKGNP